MNNNKHQAKIVNKTNFIGTQKMETDSKPHIGYEVKLPRYNTITCASPVPSKPKRSTITSTKRNVPHLPSISIKESTGRSLSMGRVHKNYGLYQYLNTPKLGSPSSLNFVSRLRVSEDFSSTISRRKSKEEPFSFYSKDMKKWQERVHANRERDIHQYRGIEVGPSINSVLKLFDAEAKGNTGLIEHLLRHRSDKSVISFATKLRNYKKSAIKRPRKLRMFETLYNEQEYPISFSTGNYYDSDNFVIRHGSNSPSKYDSKRISNEKCIALKFNSPF